MIAQRFVELPLLIWAWGVQATGDWLLLTAMIAYVNLGDLGIVVATRNRLAICLAERRIDEAKQAYGAAFAVILAVGLGVEVVILGCSLAIAEGHLFAGEVLSPTASGIVLALTGTSIVVRLQIGLRQAVLWAGQLNHVGLSAWAFIQLAALGAETIAVLAGGGAPAAAAAMLASDLGGLVLMSALARRYVPELHLTLRVKGLGAAGRELWLPSAWSLTFFVSNLLNVQGTRILVGYLLGNTALVQFTAIRTICKMVAQFLTVVSAGIEPDLADSFGRSDLVRFRMASRLVLRLALWIAVAGYTALFLSGPWLFAIWLNGKVAFDWPSFALIIIESFLFCVWQTAMRPAFATNQHGRLAMIMLTLFGFGSMLAVLVGTQIAGLTGACAGLALSSFLVTILVVADMLRLTGGGWGELMSELSPVALVRSLIRGSRQLAGGGFGGLPYAARPAAIRTRITRWYR